MSDVRTKANALNTSFPNPGVNNPSQGFRDNTAATQLALFQAGDELSLIQNTRFTYSGDATGSSATIGAAVVIGSNPPSLEIPFTLADVRNGPNMLDTRYQDIALTIDSKGRVTNTTVVSSPIAFDTSHVAGTPIEPLGSAMGQGSGQVTFPTFTFNALGRLTATGLHAMSYGLREQQMTYGALLVGQGTNKSAELLSPANDGSAYSLIANGPQLSWLPVSTGTVTGVVAGAGIHVTPSANAPQVSLDINNLTASASLASGSLFPWHDLTDGQPKKITYSQLQNQIVKVVTDVTPQLGGDLEVGNFVIKSTQGNLNLTGNNAVLVSSNTAINLTSGSIQLASKAAAPKSVMTVSETTLALSSTGSSGLTLNGLLWPSANGATGQFLTAGANNTLTWSSVAQFNQTVPNTVFVSNSGNDSTGTGSLNNPYATITKALAVTPKQSANFYTVMLLGGTYAENLNIGNITNLSLESFFAATRSKLTGTMQLGFGLQTFNMNKITLDNSARDASDQQPVFGLSAGIGTLTVTDCDILRGPDAKSDLPAIDLYGDITGNVTFNNCMIQGKVTNVTNSYNGAALVVNNAIQPSNGWMRLETNYNSITTINGVPLLKGIIHNGGLLSMSNVESVLPVNLDIGITNPSLPVWVNGQPSYVTDSDGTTLLLVRDSDGQPTYAILLDPSGNPIPDTNNPGQYLQTQYVQLTQAQPNTIITYVVGLYSTANLVDSDGNTLGASRLSLDRVNFYNAGTYSKIYKSGLCGWRFTDVKRRADQDFISGPRIVYDVTPDAGEFLAHYVASGSTLKNESDNSGVLGAVVDPQSGTTFQITLTAPSIITLKTPAATSYSGGEFYFEVVIAIKQDGTGNKSVNFAETSGTGITWLTDISPSQNPNALTFYSFRYFSSSRKWIASRQADNLKIANVSSQNYTLSLTDVGNYLRRTFNSANTVTVPTSSSVQFVIGAQIQVVQAGGGRTSIVAAPGVVINSPYGYTLLGQFSKVTLTKVANNIWDLEGSLDTTQHTAPALTVDSSSVTADSADVTADNG